MPSEMQGRRGSMPMTRSLSMIAKNQVPTETSSVSIGPQSGPKAESQDLAFVLKNFKEIEKWSGPTKRILFSIVTTAKYASYSKFDAKIIFLRRSMVAMAIISIALSIYANEIRTSPSFTGVTQTMTLDNLCLAGVTVLTVTMFFCNLSLKYWAGREDYLSAHLQRNHKVQPAWAIFANMVQGGLLSFEHMLELLIVLPHMPPYLALTFSYNTDYYGVPKVNTYRMESLAAMWTLLRLYMAITLVRDEVLQEYTNKRIIEQNTKIRIHSVFATKLLMSEQPVRCVIFVSLVFCFSAGYWLKVVEGGINPRFSSYLDCMWCLVITFWTIGYGDLFPTTLLGRFVAVITGFLGIVTAAIITATLANGMQFSVKEFFAKSTLDRELYEKQYITAAAKFLQGRWRVSKFSHRLCCPRRQWDADFAIWMQAKREYMNWKASLFNIEETVNRSRTFISRSRMHLHNLASKVVTDHGTLLSLGINAGDDKERKLRESLAIRNIRAQKEQVILKNIRHVGNEVAGISSQISNKSVAEVTAAVESKARFADSSKKSIYTGDIKIARAAAEALKQQLTRNVELLSSMNALLFPQPGAHQPMEFSRFDDTSRVSSERPVNESSSGRHAGAPSEGAKSMRLYSPKAALAANGRADAQSSAPSSAVRRAPTIAKSKSKSNEVFDEGGNAVSLMKLPPPNSFSAQLVPGGFMQHPDGSVVKKRDGMYAL